MKSDQIPQGKKACLKCGVYYLARNYSTWRQGDRIYYKSVCNKCRSKKYRSTPENNQKVLANQRARNAGLRRNRWKIKYSLLEHINQFACRDCGASDIRCLAFHHRDGVEKSFNLKSGFSRLYSLARMKVEAEKCDVLCMNCHAIRHYLGPQCRHLGHQKRAAQAITMKNALMAAMGQSGCEKCGFEDLRALSFHHQNGRNKKFGLSDAIHAGMPFDNLLIEAKKCAVLCLNCHVCLHSEEAE